MAGLFGGRLRTETCPVLLAGMNSQLALGLPAVPPSDTVVINARCTVRTEGDQRVIVVGGLPVYHYCTGDAVAESYAMVMLVDSGFAQQTELAWAFGRTERTIRRHQERYAAGGMVGLGRPEGWRRGRRRISGKRLWLIERLKAQGLSNRAIAQRLGVNEKAIRKLVGPSRDEPLEQLAWVPVSVPVAREPAAPTLACSVSSTSESEDGAEPALAMPATIVAPVDARMVGETTEEAEPVPLSLDQDASDRTCDRQMAYLGLLEDAAPMFRDGERVPGLGALLAVPFLVHSGVLRIARKLYGGIGPAFYGLRTTLLTLFLMALLRVQRPEQLKERDPATFGRLLGLDRAPEVKTLRRALGRLAAHHCAEQMGAQLARVRVAGRGELMGFLYVDGHVRAYHGERTISKAYVARRHLAMPATTDYWINDRGGDPLLLITAELDASLAKAFPELLSRVRTTLGEGPVTIVFDRGGWSPKLFRSMIKQSFDILTYRKGKGRLVEERRFVHRRAKLDGCWVSYDLHDQAVRFLKGKLRLRQTTRLCEGGHQTQIITSRGSCATSKWLIACSIVGGRRTSSSTCARSSYSMRSSTTGSSRRTPPAASPIQKDARSRSSAAPPARNSLKSSVSTGPPPPTTPSSTARRCAASRSPTASSVNNYEPPGSICAGSCTSGAVFRRAFRSGT
jgi:transposase